MDGELRALLLRLIRYKFASYPNVTLLAEDIVQDAYLTLRTSKQYSPEKENYGYMSVVCVRLAYRKFMNQAMDFNKAAVCAEEIRNLAYALSCLFNNDLAKKYMPDVTPWAAKPMTTATAQSEFLLLDIGGIPVVEPLKNVVEIMVTGYTEMEQKQGSIHARNRVLPLADGYKLLGKPQKAKIYAIVDTPWAEQNNRYAVAAQLSCIFVSPIGNPMRIASDMPLAKFVRECWENENGEPFYFMDWTKMI